MLSIQATYTQWDRVQKLTGTPLRPTAGSFWNMMKMLKIGKKPMDGQIFGEVEHLTVHYLICPLFVGFLPNSPVYLATQVPRN